MKSLKKYAQTRLKTEIEIIRRSEIANFLPELSLEEKAIIYKYTVDGHFVNETLRESQGKKVPEFAYHLDNVLSKLPSSNLVVYRGVKFSPARLKLYAQALENETRLTEYGFISSSIRRSTANHFGTIILRIFSKNGKLIEKTSKFGINSSFNEKDVVFTKDSQFIVLEIKEENPYFIVTLEEV